MRILGLDVGEKRIGVAKVDSETKIAVPVGYIVVDGTEWQELSRLARLNNVSLFVLGLPRSNEGNETKQTLYVRQFAKDFVEKMPDAKIRFQDESLTSVEAEARLKQRKKKYEKGDIDAEAAAIILQDFIENFKIDSAQSVQKEANKVMLNAKKVQNETKKLTRFLVIPPILLAVILLGITAVLKYRDYVRWQREEEYAKQEAEMEANTFNFTIRPGETIFDIKKNLLSVDRNGGRDYGENNVANYTLAEIEAALAADYDFDFLESRPAGASLEGYLYPETHNFYSDASVEDILKKFLAGMQAVINENNLANRYLTQGLTLYEGITLASIVQKEAPSPEQPTVAQVFLTRLSYGIPLGSDVTVSYALDVVDPSREIYMDNQSALRVDSCYNTRLYAGLPCGPISNPGLNALLAVANPTDTSYFYFLTGDDGVMYYSYTETEHNQNIYLHCQALCNVSL